MPTDPSSEESGGFAYPPALNADLLWKEKDLHSSQRTKTTLSTADRTSSSMLSSAIMSSGDLLHKMILDADLEEEEDEEGHLNDVKEEPHRKKDREEKRSSYHRHSSRKTVDSSSRRHRRRKEDDETADTRERRKSHRDRRGQDDRTTETRERHKERRERRSSGGDDDHHSVDTLEHRKERKARHEHRRDEEGTRSSRLERTHSERSHRHRHSSTERRHHGGGSTHRQSSSNGRLEGSRAPREIFVEGVAHMDRPYPSHHHHHHHEGRAEAPGFKTPPRKQPDLNVPKTILAVPQTPPSDLDGEVQDSQERKARLKSDYDRLMELLLEQNEIMDRHLREVEDEPSPESSTEVGRLQASLHPLIAVSDREFQQAFDALARDSVFDDNFEQAFNEFSEHYLALSPWSEEDSMEKDEDKKPSDQHYDHDEQDFIQIPLTPVARKDLYDTKQRPKSKTVHKGRKTERPRTPVLERGVLSSSDMEKKDKLKELPGDDEFVEVSRRPLYRRTTSSPVLGEEKAQELARNDPQDDEFVQVPRKAYTVRRHTEEPSGEIKSSWAHLHETPEADAAPPAEADEAPPSEHASRRKWRLLRGKRSSSKAAV